MAQGNLITPPTLRVAVSKPKMTVYYALLFVALGAILTACLFLYLEIRRFGGFGTVKGKVASIAQPANFVSHCECGIRGEIARQLAAANSVVNV